MNREQRRKQAKHKNHADSKINCPMTKDEFEKLSGDFFSAIMACSMLILHDKFGFGRSRLDVFRREVWLAIEANAQGYASIEDYDNVIAEECYKGVKIKNISELIEEKNRVEAENGNKHH